MMGKINRVIFLFLTKFSQREYRRFSFDIIQKRGYKVESWDCSKWIDPNYSRQYDVPDPSHFSGQKILDTLEETNEAIKALTENDVVVDSWNITQNYNIVYVVIW